MYTDPKFPVGAPEWHASKVFTYLITWRAQLEILMLQFLRSDPSQSLAKSFPLNVFFVSGGA